MRKRSFAFLLVMVVLSIALMDSGRAACKRTMYARVSVEIDEAGAVMIPVQIKDRNAWMTMGMQTGLPTMYRSAAASLGLTMGPPEMTELTLRPDQLAVQVDSLIVGGAGGVSFANWEMYIVDSVDGETPMYRNRPVLGVLSSNLLRVVDMELNLRQKQLNLYSQSSGCGKDVVYWGGDTVAVRIFYDQSGLLLFPMEIDGQKVETALNTMSGLSKISERVTRAFFGFDRDSTGIQKEALDDGDEIASYRAMGLTAKELALTDVPVQLKADLNGRCEPSRKNRASGAIGFPGCANSTPLSIGTDLLRNLRIYIASRQGKIYFTRVGPDAATAATPSAAD